MPRITSFYVVSTDKEEEFEFSLPTPHSRAPDTRLCALYGRQEVVLYLSSKMHLQNFISVLQQPGKYILKPEFSTKHNSGLLAILLQRSASETVQWSFDYLQSPGSSVYVKR